MDAIQLLKSQHREVEQLFKAYEEQEDLKAVRQVLENLTIHAEIEEKVFYPAYKQAAEEKDIILESVEEHRLCKILISELRELSRDDDPRDPDHARDHADPEPVASGPRLHVRRDVLRIDGGAIDRRRASGVDAVARRPVAGRRAWLASRDQGNDHGNDEETTHG